MFFPAQAVQEKGKWNVHLKELVKVQKQVKHVVADRPALKVRVLQKQPLRKLHKPVARVPQRHTALVLCKRRVLPASLNQKGLSVLRELPLKLQKR